MNARLDRIFKLSERGTNVRTEITAGLTTFAAMAYILAVNPQILSTTGMDFGAVVTATALASVPCVLIMLLMPLTFSISEGLAIGFVAYAAFALGAGRGRNLSLTTWLLAALFLLHLLFR